MKKDMQLVAVKPVGAMGRVVIPAALRHLLGLEAGKLVNIYKAGDALVLMAALHHTKRGVYRRPGDD